MRGFPVSKRAVIRAIDIGSSDTRAAAFQLAIWEIINETNTSGWDLNSGTFRASASSTTINTAETWLSELNGLPPRANLMALTSATAQDYVVQAPVVQSPAPPGVVLGLCGIFCLLLPLGLRRWRLAANGPAA